MAFYVLYGEIFSNEIYSAVQSGNAACANTSPSATAADFAGFSLYETAAQSNVIVSALGLLLALCKWELKICMLSLLSFSHFYSILCYNLFNFKKFIF